MHAAWMLALVSTVFSEYLKVYRLYYSDGVMLSIKRKEGTVGRRDVDTLK